MLGERTSSAAIWLTQALLIVVCLYVFLHGWQRDIRVPLRFSVDSLPALMQSKSTLDNGWWWSNPMLGAPYALDERAFPNNSNVDQALVWMAGQGTRNIAAATTLAWTMMVVLSGLSASWCLRKLGASTVSSVMAGTLFAFSPYALYRNIEHFWLVIYLIPFPCTAALLLASGRTPARWFWQEWGAVLAGCLLLGFNYVYYSFFGCFCVGVATLVGWATHRSARTLAAGGVCVALIAGCTFLNLVPSFYSWSRHGRPLIVRDKVPAEAEVYGLKIRQLLTPLRYHAFPPFSTWAEKDAAANFPLETENVISRLGFVGSLGFLGLLGLLFVPGGAGRLVHGKILIAASQLTLAAVLLGTVGGFSSLFSLLVSPDIRAYNRICPFIAFFSLTAVAIAIDSWGKTVVRRVMIAGVVLTLGLADEGTAAVNLNTAYPAIAAEMPSLEAFVHQLEIRLPDGAMVLQLPFRTYLNDDGVARMGSYDHFKLYLVSRRIHWSYPAMSNEQVRWQQAAARVDSRRLPYRLAAEGFAAIVVDRFGYQDNGDSVIAAVRAGLGAYAVLAQTDRYTALDIRGLAGIDRSITSDLSDAGGAVATLKTCPGPVLAAIDQIGMMTAPVTGVHVHGTGSAVHRLSGWAIDQATGLTAQGVDVVVDQESFESVYGGDRSDVSDYFRRNDYKASGFIAAIPRERFGKGQHTLALRVVASDGHCYYQTPNSSIVVD